MSRSSKNSKLKIVHFNDVYNVDEKPIEPKGGAARFVTAIKNARTSRGIPSLVIFSGDAFSPATLSPYTKGAEMPVVLNAIGVDVACLGNHDLDFGLEVMYQRVQECNFPWICSNVKCTQSGEPLDGIMEYVILEKEGFKIGFIGLASPGWVSVLDKVPNGTLSVEDPSICVERLGKKLKEMGCNFLIGLTHMRKQEDRTLLDTSGNFLDLVLGGHDHVTWACRRGGKWSVKSGSDFKVCICYATNQYSLKRFLSELTLAIVVIKQQFSTILIEDDNLWSTRVSRPEFHEVTSEVRKDEFIESFVVEQLEILGPGHKKVLGYVRTELDGRFVSIRTRESNLCNLFCDIRTNLFLTLIIG